MDEEFKKELKNNFDFIDTNNNGAICVDELKRFKELTGDVVTEQHIKDIVKNLISLKCLYKNIYSFVFQIKMHDMNHDGMITFDEFLLMWEKALEEEKKRKSD